MTFKSDKQPYCRCCGKPISKHTNHFYLTTEMTELERQSNQRHSGSEYQSRYIEVPSFPKTKAQLQAFSNARITSVKYTEIRDNYDDDDPKDRYISQFTSWDGESYRDQFFCNRTACAVDFAYALAKANPSLRLRKPMEK